MLLEFSGVKKIYPGPPETVALSDVSFGVETGSLTAIVGPSGSGKTTMLNLASGLDRVTAGTIRIGNQTITALDQKALARFRLEALGFVFQSYNLFPSLRAIENVEFTMAMRGLPEPEARELARRALEQVGLKSHAEKFPNQLSGGQQQRVAVARAIAGSPQIVFADEPTANLDTKSALHLIDLFLDLNRQKTTTFLFSTHDMRLVDRVHRQIRVEDGRILT